MTATQQTFEFERPRLLVVKNFWGPVYHLQYDTGLAPAWTPRPPAFFFIEGAVKYAEARGQPAEVSDECRRWENWSAEQLRRWRHEVRLTRIRSRRAVHHREIQHAKKWGWNYTK